MEPWVDGIELWGARDGTMGTKWNHEVLVLGMEPWGAGDRTIGSGGGSMVC